MAPPWRKWLCYAMTVCDDAMPRVPVFFTYRTIGITGTDFGLVQGETVDESDHSTSATSRRQ